MAATEPTESQRVAIAERLDGVGSAYSVDDVVHDYDRYCRWAGDLHDVPTFSAWLAASGWMED